MTYNGLVVETLEASRDIYDNPALSYREKATRLEELHASLQDKFSKQNFDTFVPPKDQVSFLDERREYQHKLLLEYGTKCFIILFMLLSLVVVLDWATVFSILVGRKGKYQ